MRRRTARCSGIIISIGNLGSSCSTFSGIFQITTTKFKLIQLAAINQIQSIILVQFSVSTSNTQCNLAGLLGDAQAQLYISCTNINRG